MGVAEGTYATGQLTRNELITAHIGLARSLARRYSGRGETDDDLIQVAMYGLIRAVDRFDPSRGFAFSTFARATILGELKHHFRGARWGVHVSRSVQERYLHSRQSTEMLTSELGRSPTLAEVADHAGITEEQVIEALEASASFRIDSLDAPSDEAAGVGELGTVDHGYEAVEERNALTRLLARLPARERLIVRLRFIDELPQSEIAARVGHSQMHVSRLLARSLAKLREWAADEGVLA